MAEKKNEVAEKPKQSFSVSLTESLNEVSGALPTGFNKPRFVQNAVALLNENETLAKFASAQKNGVSQIQQGMLKAAYLGLDFMSKEAYLIPYGSTLNFMVDYRGNVKLAKKYSIRPILDIYAKVVREKDDFEETVVNGKPSISFKPLPFNDGKVIGAFAVVLYKDGGMEYDTMSLKDLENTRSASKAKNSPAWTKFTEEMYKKTVLHRLCKHIELEFDNPKQNEYFSEDMAIETDKQKIVENEVKENANTEDFIEPEVETVHGEVVADADYKEADLGMSEEIKNARPPFD